MTRFVLPVSFWCCPAITENYSANTNIFNSLFQEHVWSRKFPCHKILKFGDFQVFLLTQKGCMIWTSKQKTFPATKTIPLPGSFGNHFFDHNFPAASRQPWKEGPAVIHSASRGAPSPPPPRVSRLQVHDSLKNPLPGKAILCTHNLGHVLTMLMWCQFSSSGFSQQMKPKNTIQLVFIYQIQTDPKNYAVYIKKNIICIFTYTYILCLLRTQFGAHLRFENSRSASRPQNPAPGVQELKVAWMVCLESPLVGSSPDLENGLGFKIMFLTSHSLLRFFTMLLWHDMTTLRKGMQAYTCHILHHHSTTPQPWFKHLFHLALYHQSSRHSCRSCAGKLLEQETKTNAWKIRKLGSNKILEKTACCNHILSGRKSRGVSHLNQTSESLWATINSDVSSRNSTHKRFLGSFLLQSLLNKSTLTVLESRTLHLSLWNRHHFWMLLANIANTVFNWTVILIKNI